MCRGGFNARGVSLGKTAPTSYTTPRLLLWVEEGRFLGLGSLRRRFSLQAPQAGLVRRHPHMPQGASLARLERLFAASEQHLQRLDGALQLNLLRIREFGLAAQNQKTLASKARQPCRPALLCFGDMAASRKVHLHLLAPRAALLGLDCALHGCCACRGADGLGIHALCCRLQTRGGGAFEQKAGIPGDCDGDPDVSWSGCSPHACGSLDDVSWSRDSPASWRSVRSANASKGSIKHDKETRHDSSLLPHEDVRARHVGRMHPKPSVCSGSRTNRIQRITRNQTAQDANPSGSSARPSWKGERCCSWWLETLLVVFSGLAR